MKKKTSTGKVLSIIPRLEEKRAEEGDFRVFTVRQALEEALKDLDDPESTWHHATKAVLIPVNDSDHNYEVSFIQAGLKMSECVSLMEIAKQHFLRLMGYK